jgi:glucoamylase
LQVGVVAVIIPDPNNPQFSVYWLRDACLVYYVWLNELTVLSDKNFRPMADDMTHALIRTQQVVSIAGNVLSGGIGEAVFDIKINPIQSEDSRIGSPAAGE